MNVVSRDLLTLLLSTLRYSLGRMTYVVDDCDRCIRLYGSVLTSEGKRLLVEELRDTLDAYDAGKRGLGQDIDVHTWRSLYAWMQQEGWG